MFPLLWYYQHERRAQAATSRIDILWFAVRDLAFVNTELQQRHRVAGTGAKPRTEAMERRKAQRATGPQAQKIRPKPQRHRQQQTNAPQGNLGLAQATHHTRPYPHPSLADIAATMRSPLSKDLWGKVTRQVIIYQERYNAMGRYLSVV